jgi:uncharacterized protein YjbI with pentapeptide repeats
MQGRKKRRLVVGGIAGGVLVYVFSRESSRYQTGAVLPSVVLGALMIVGIALISAGQDDRQVRADIGQGLIVGVVVAIAIGWWQSSIQHSINDAAEEQNLRLTLTVQHDLTGIDLEGKEDLPTYLRSKKLREANFIDADLEEVDLTRSDLTKARMHRSRLREAVFHKARMGRAELPEAVGEHTDFTEVRAPELGLEGTELAWADFTGARLRGSYLEEAQLQHAIFVGAHMREIFAREVNLEEAQLDKATLQNADLTKADLIGASLIGADLTDAELGYANLTEAHLGDSVLKNATYNSKTVWPSWFDPSSAGAKEVP